MIMHPKQEACLMVEGVAIYHQSGKPESQVSIIIITYIPLKPYFEDICDWACENRPSEPKKLPIFSVFAVS